MVHGSWFMVFLESGLVHSYSRKNDLASEVIRLSLRLQSETTIRPKTNNPPAMNYEP